MRLQLPDWPNMTDFPVKSSLTSVDWKRYKRNGPE